MKAILLVAFVYLISLALPAMSSPAVVLFWVTFTLVSMLGILYQASIDKANKQQKFVSGGIAARINNGRFIRIIVSFALSALLMASLLLESPKWDAAEWAFIITAAVLYPFVKFIVGKLTKREYETIFKAAAEIRWTSVTIAVLLCTGYAVYSWLNLNIGLNANSTTVLEAFIATPRLFANAPSALMQEAGIGMWITDSVVNYGFTQLSQMPWPVCIAFHVGLCAGAFFGMANLLGVCSLSWGELRKAFIPTDAIKNNNAQTPTRRRYIICVAFLSAILVIGFSWADDKTAQAMQTEGGTMLQSLARQLAGE